jgi:NADH-quinone oxidoreductase subunit C
VADGAQAIELLEKRFGDAIVERGSFRDQHWAVVEPKAWRAVAAWLRDDPATLFDVLLDVTAVHWPDREAPIEIVAHLYSHAKNDRLRLKSRVGNQGPIDSLVPLWASANWNEREAFDMFGVVFTDHPDLRRILMSDDYTDHPLRKELPLFRG